MSDSTTYCIYRITCLPNHLIYIGKTHNPTRRKHEHFGELRRNDHHNKHLQKAYNKYGKEAFSYDIIEGGISADTIDSREVYWIAYFDSYHNGFNMDIGGAGGMKGARATCEWNGIKYPSIKAAADAIGITYANMVRRRVRGLKNDSQMVGTGNDAQRRKTVFWNGVKYSGIQSAANANGVSYSVMQYRLGLGFENDSEIPSSRIRSRTPCQWNGEHYTTISEAARAVGISQQAMNERIVKGYTCDDDFKRKSIANKSHWSHRER